MPTYATKEDFEAYVPGWETTDEDQLIKLLEQAEQDVDFALGPGAPNETTMLKLDPDGLLGYQKKALSRAVCAQAEYRLHQGEEFFLEWRPDTFRTPDNRTQRLGRENYISPKARMELTRGKLMLLVTSNYHKFTGIPNQNVDDYIP